MRATLGAAIVFFTVAAAASAAERGQIGIHLGAGSTSHGASLGRSVDTDLAFSYQLTDRLSLRPHLSVGHSSSGGWSFGLGGTALRHFRPGKRLGPYLGAGLLYRTHDTFGTARPDVLPGFDLSSSPPDAVSRHFVTFSVTGGMEYSIGRRLSLFAEVEGRYRTGRHWGYDGRPRSAFDVRPVLGLTLKLR